MSESIVISNLPFTCNTYELNNYFSGIGLIKRCFLIKDEYKEFTGRAQITYREVGHAAEAVNKLNSTEFKDKVILVKKTSEERHKYGFTDNKNEQFKKRITPDDESATDGPLEKKMKIETGHSIANNQSDSENKIIIKTDDSTVTSQPKKKLKIKSAVSIINNEFNNKNNIKNNGPSKKKFKNTNFEPEPTIVSNNSTNSSDETDIKFSDSLISDETDIKFSESLIEQPVTGYHSDQLGRIVVKNIPSQTNHENVYTFFGKFGTIEEINIPHSNRYKKRNCCMFIQFHSPLEAERAIENCATHQFLGCSVTASNAVPKGKYQLQENGVQDDEKKEKKLSKKDRKRIQNQLKRVVIRNLPFTATEGDVRKFFSTHGVVKDVTFPQTKGCGFIQFSSGEEAVRAIEKCNLQQFMGRSVIVEQAMPKDQYQHQPKSEEEGVVKTEDESSPHKSVKVKSERIDASDYDHSDSSRDVDEGRTVFLSQLAIDTTSFSIKTLLSTFGELKYVMLVTDKLSEQSKGTAFAQFTTRESADACLAASEDPSRELELTVDRRVMQVQRALGRGMNNAAKIPVPTKGKDKRNLYLAREGFIREGTQSATDVSPKDLKLRRLREQSKQKLLSNLQMFVSPTRLCVNNLPLALTDPLLREIFKKHAPPKAKLTEARIMRYLNDVDNVTGMAVSRTYGFVNFTRHEDALAALRTVNNNPEVFTSKARPIVEFSIENKAVINLKQQRLKKSRDGNKKGKNNKDNNEVDPSSHMDETLASKTYSGFTAKRGDLKPGQKLHKHLGAKVRRRDLGKKNPYKKTKGGAKTKSKSKFKSKPSGKSKGSSAKKSKARKSSKA